jgi:hypothetical protein
LDVTARIAACGGLVTAMKLQDKLILLDGAIDLRELLKRKSIGCSLQSAGILFSLKIPF